MKNDTFSNVVVLEPFGGPERFTISAVVQWVPFYFLESIYFLVYYIGIPIISYSFVRNVGNNEKNHIFLA